MSGRFFAMPLLVSALVLVRVIRHREAGLALGAALLIYNVVAPLAPVKTRADYPDGGWSWRLQNGIKDERGHYHQFTNVLFYAPFKALPDHLWYRQGTSFRNGAEKVSIQGSIGFFGFTAGPEKYVIDRNALSDPLLARLPVSESLYFGSTPATFSGNCLAVTSSPAASKEPDRRPAAARLLDKLLNVTAGPIFTLQRARDVWELNSDAIAVSTSSLRNAVQLACRCPRTTTGSRPTSALAIPAATGR